MVSAVIISCIIAFVRSQGNGVISYSLQPASV